MFPKPRPRHLDDYTDTSDTESREESGDDSCAPTQAVTASVVSVPTKVDVPPADDDASAPDVTAASACAAAETDSSATSALSPSTPHHDAAISAATRSWPLVSLITNVVFLTAAITA
eukprot:6192877-Pleurochrysis_carterae.AAC.1